MSVYVDRAANGFRRMVMCHMIADTPEELAAMADKIGVALRWFQAEASMPHFDICKSKKLLALKAGAVECDRKSYVEHMRRIRESWPRDERGRWLLQGKESIDG